MKKTKLRKFRVWTGQVNQIMWHVTAKDEEEAKEKACRKWRREITAEPTYIEAAE